MGIRIRLTIMSFLQFFVWGAWLITIGTYCLNAKGWSFPQFGAIFSTLALSSLFMPALTGIIADKWLNAERLYGILHILYGCILFLVPGINNPGALYYVIFAAMICYMPTISLSNSIAYTILKNNRYDVVKVFPPIRVWGTVGFIMAMWATNVSGSKANANQFLIAGAMAELKFRSNPNLQEASAQGILKLKPDPVDAFVKMVDAAKGGTLFIDEAYRFSPNKAASFINRKLFLK